MSVPLSFALVQYNFHVGFLEANTAKICALYKIVAAAGTQLVIFSEMAITGYPPEDLVLSKRFQELSMETVEALATLTKKSAAMLVGGLWREEGDLYNAVFLLEDGKIAHRQYKHHLPNYGVFDEKRVFAAGTMPEPVLWRGIKLGLMVCEDMWYPDVTDHLKAQGAQILISINASPYETGKASLRESVALERVRATGLPLVYVNQVGGQDCLVFDGGSFVLSGAGETCVRMHALQEDLALLYWTKHNDTWQPVKNVIQPVPEDLPSMYYAMVVGLKDFVQKNGFQGIVLGISGGIDSALSAAVAVDALGKDRVHLIMLPSSVTSQESMDDAKDSAHLLGARLDIIPIDPGIAAFKQMMTPLAGEHFAIVEANNHTRLRASILLAISAEEKALLLTTGNKSELATGYTTMYGDLSGYYSVLRDVYKTTVYRLAHWRNAQGRVIPEHSITREPTGETMPGQKDQDTLPPYDLLDEILHWMVEEQFSVDEVIALGFERVVVEKVRNMLFAAEYKRWQSSPGVKLTKMSFNNDRRYPLTSMWRAEKLILEFESDIEKDHATAS